MASCGAPLGYLCGTTTESSELQPALVMVEHQKRIFGAKTVVELVPAKEQQGRQQELGNIEWLGVRRVITLHQNCRLRPYSCDAETRGHGDQFLCKGGRQPVHSSNQVFPAGLVIGFVTRGLVRTAQQTCCQVRRSASGKIVVIPLKGLVESGCCWLLQMDMCGTREVSICWGN